MHKKELSVYSSFDMNPDLVKKLAELTNKIDKMERIQNRERSDANQRVSRSRDRKFGRGSSPPVQSITCPNYSPKYQINKQIQSTSNNWKQQLEPIKFGQPD